MVIVMVLITMVIVMVLITMVIVMVTPSSGFDGFHPTAGINHNEIFVVRRADEVLKELLHAEPVFDKDFCAAESRQG